MIFYCQWCRKWLLERIVCPHCKAEVPRSTTYLVGFLILLMVYMVAFAAVLIWSKRG